MAKLTMTKGLPASGKSTWAQAQKGAKIVNKDDIRARLGRPWSKDLEKEVLRVRDFEVSQVLSKGDWVISSDTNLAPAHGAHLGMLAKKYKAAFEIKDFTDVGLEECIRRDRLREAKVGEKVIREMAENYLKPSELISRPAGNGKQLFLDLDGVFADFDGFIERELGIVNNRENEDPDFWDKARGYKGRLFFDMSPLPYATRLFKALKSFNPIILTGCPWSISTAADDKREWVAKHLDRFVQVIPCKSRNKSLYARPGDIILDDWEKYKHLWAGMGGTFITHTDPDRSIVAVKEALK